MVERGRSSQRQHGVGSPRSSQRSHGTSSSSSHESKFTCKDFSRKFVSFMCTQVGVGGLMVSYAIIGAFSFIEIEGHNNVTLTNLTTEIHLRTIKDMWCITEKHNLLNRQAWNISINDSLFKFQEQMVEKITKEGYDGKEREAVWGNFSATLMFCLSVFTMIGYGHMTPRSDLGKIATVVYAIFGIPLYIVYFMNMGKVFAKSFKFLYRSVYRCLNKKDDDQDIEQNLWEETNIVVPYTACIWVMIFYMLIGTIMFAIWEGWTYVDSWYFSFTSLAKIGLGDLVPGKKRYDQSGPVSQDSTWKLLINFIYLLIGMGLIAMCCTLMREEIHLKLRTTKQELREKCYYCGLRLGLYTEDQPISLPSDRKTRHKMVRRTVRRR